MRALLLVTDDSRRRRLAAACREADPPIGCIESAPAIDALFMNELGRLTLVVLDPASLQRYGQAWLVNWRRMMPHGGVLVLGEDADADLDRLQRALQRAAPGA